jgi:hypothetical protein
VRTLQRKFISARGAGHRRRDSSREPLRAGGHAGDLTAVNHYALAVGPRRWLILGVLCVTLLLVTVDDTILNVALPSIVRELRATSTQLQWIVDAFAIFFAGLGAPLGTNPGWNRPQ